MQTGRKSGLIYSGALHAALLIIAILGLPDLFDSEREMEPSVITVDILPIAAISNVKPASTPPKEEVKPEETPKPTPEKELKKPQEEVKDIKKEQPKTVQAQEKPPEPTPVVEKKKEEKPEPKKEEKKKEEKPKPKKEDDLAAVLKSVKETAQKKQDDATPAKEPSEKDSSASRSNSTKYNPDLPLSVSEVDAIRNQFIKCWSVPAGAKDGYSLVVVLRVLVNQDGAVTDVKLAKDHSRYNGESFFRAAADSAIRAVWRCSPLQNLPADKYDRWRDMELTFDPKEMLY